MQASSTMSAMTSTSALAGQLAQKASPSRRSCPAAPRRLQISCGLNPPPTMSTEFAIELHRLCSPGRHHVYTIAHSCCTLLIRLHVVARGSFVGHRYPGTAKTDRPSSGKCLTLPYAMHVKLASYIFEPPPPPPPPPFPHT